MQDFNQWLEYVGQNLMQRPQMGMSNNLLNRSSQVVSNVADGNTNKSEIAWLLNAAKEMLKNDPNSITYLAKSLMSYARTIQPVDTMDMSKNPNARGTT